MAKQIRSFNMAPWKISQSEVDNNYIMVTPENWPRAKKFGRIMYLFGGGLYRGFVTIDPCFTRGKWLYPWMPWEKKPAPHFQVYIPEDFDLDNYQRTWKALIKMYLEEKTLYINPQDPILTYHKLS